MFPKKLGNSAFPKMDEEVLSNIQCVVGAYVHIYIYMHMFPGEKG